MRPVALAAAIVEGMHELVSPLRVQPTPWRALVCDAPQLVRPSLGYHASGDDPIWDGGEVEEQRDEALVDHVLDLRGGGGDASVLVKRQEVGHEDDLLIEVGVETHAVEQEADQLPILALRKQLLGEVEVDARALLALLARVGLPEAHVALAASQVP